MRNRKLMRIAAALAAGMVLASGCGSSQSTATTAAETAAEETAAETTAAEESSQAEESQAADEEDEDGPPGDRRSGNLFRRRHHPYFRGNL